MMKSTSPFAFFSFCAILLGNTFCSIRAAESFPSFLIPDNKGNYIIKKDKELVEQERDQNGNHALHYAAAFIEDRVTFNWLLDVVKFPIDSKGYKQKSPFIFAAEKGNLSALKILKEKGANVHATDENGNNALHYAAMFVAEGRSIVWLITIAKLSTESKNYCCQETPFILAAKWGNLHGLKMLRANGANMHIIGKNSNNALHCAAAFAPEGRGILWLITSAGLSIESKKSCCGETPFLVAAENGNLAALKILKANGANIYARDKTGNNALHYAAVAPEGEGIEWLINIVHLDIESRNIDQRTPFMMAAKENNLAALKVFKTQGANIEQIDAIGFNALDIANGKETIHWLKAACGLRKNCGYVLGKILMYGLLAMFLLAASFKAIYPCIKVCCRLLTWTAETLLWPEKNKFSPKALAFK